jgi:tetratricopeptide (TPR) repeat protein
MKKNILIVLLIAGLAGMFLGCQVPKSMQQVKWKAKPTKIDQSLEHYELGLKLEADGERQKAIEQYEASVQISPRPIVYYRLGLLYADDQKYDKAADNYKKALVLNPNYTEAKKELDSLPVK